MSKKLPYGVSDFNVIIRKDYYYVDKTRYIPQIEEQPDFLFLIRPRRFGKRQFLRMLTCYFDFFFKDRFDDLFGNLWIGKNRTPKQGSYRMLCLDFSKEGGDLDELEGNCKKCICETLDEFMRKYNFHGISRTVPILCRGAGA